MKANIFWTLFILTVFLFSGCKNDSNTWDWEDGDYLVSDVLYANGAKLKQVSSKGENQWYVTSTYAYDQLGRISKVTYPMYASGIIIGDSYYESYVYNTSNQLEKIHNYHNRNSGFELMSTYHFVYDSDGNQQKKIIEYHYNQQVDSVLYFYENNRLIRTDTYDNGSIIPGPTSTIYEYDNQGHLILEASFSAANSTSYGITKHSYQNNLNVKTETSSGTLIRRAYDKNNNLIYLSSQELFPYSSRSSGVSKYEYE